MTGNGQIPPLIVEGRWGGGKQGQGQRRAELEPMPFGNLARQRFSRGAEIRGFAGGLPGFRQVSSWVERAALWVFWAGFPSRARLESRKLAIPVTSKLVGAQNLKSQVGLGFWPRRYKINLSSTSSQMKTIKKLIPSLKLLLTVLMLQQSLIHYIKYLYMLTTRFQEMVYQFIYAHSFYLSSKFNISSKDCFSIFIFAFSYILLSIGCAFSGQRWPAQPAAPVSTGTPFLHRLINYIWIHIEDNQYAYKISSEQRYCELTQRGDKAASRQLGDEGAKRIFLSETDKIREVRLQQNSISSKGMSYFPKANWNNLVLIYLYLNRIGDRGCKFLSQASLNTIKQVSLRDNQIGIAGVSHLSKTGWTKLTVMYLGYNQIGVGGIECLANANWTSLNYLSLASNKIMSEQILKLLLLKSISVKRLDLWQSRQFVSYKELNYLKVFFSRRFKSPVEIIIKQG